MKYILFFLLLFSIPLFAQTVYRTPSGSKYHLASCRSVKNTSEKTTVEDARRSGLDACKICRPPLNSGHSLMGGVLKKTAGESEESFRCKGLTKTGTRCKHMTRIGNGYCHQHQP